MNTRGLVHNNQSPSHESIGNIHHHNQSHPSHLISVAVVRKNVNFSEKTSSSSTETESRLKASHLLCSCCYESIEIVEDDEHWSNCASMIIKLIKVYLLIISQLIIGTIVTSKQRKRTNLQLKKLTLHTSIPSYCYSHNLLFQWIHLIWGVWIKLRQILISNNYSNQRFSLIWASWTSWRKWIEYYVNVVLKNCYTNQCSLLTWIQWKFRKRRSNYHRTLRLLFCFNLLLSSPTPTFSFGSQQTHFSKPHHQPTIPPSVPLCPESAPYHSPTFCSTLRSSNLVNLTNDHEWVTAMDIAESMYCDMVRVLNKLDCSQPWVVSPRWRRGCQDAYHSWTCSTILSPYFPPSLPPCDSTCTSVIRTCPYLSPDKSSQLDPSGTRPIGPHPSQYGGHPSFYCPNELKSSEEWYYDGYQGNQDHGDANSYCILFSPALNNRSYSSFPIERLDLSKLVNWRLCGSASVPVESEKLIKPTNIVNVNNCCWTFNTSLPRTYKYLSSSLREGVLLDENCAGEIFVMGSEIYEKGTTDGYNRDIAEIVVQCVVTSTDNEEHEEPAPPSATYDEEYSSDVDGYQDDDPEDKYSYYLIVNNGTTGGDIADVVKASGCHRHKVLAVYFLVAAMVTGRFLI